jgi:hypothetical protein
MAPACRTAFSAHPKRPASFGLSDRTLEKHRTSGTGPAHCKLGGRVVYALKDLKAWADHGFGTSTSDPCGSVLPPKRHAAVTPAFGGGQAR